MDEWEHISAAGTYVLDPNKGILKHITVNTATGGICTVYDNTAASGRVIAQLKSGVGERTYFYNLPYVNGLTVVLVTSGDLTVVYN